MATTKVGGGVVDLNEQNTDTVFQLPVGSSLFTGTPVAGMIRYNSTNDIVEIYVDGQWKSLATV